MATETQPSAASNKAARGAVDLAHVIGDAPAAVLLVDLRTERVLHANDVALQLAPGVELPVGLDAWSDAAMLRDLDGVELSDTDHPLSRLGRREPVPGQAISAARRSELGEEREPLWVVGVPMSGAPMLDDHALVVFLAIREQGATAAVQALGGAGTGGAAMTASELELPGADGEPFGSDHEGHLYQRAVLATGLSFTVADARSEDLPLVWVNPAFTATTGYSFEESVGRNCRFLQGPATSQESRTRLRDALETNSSITETLLNYRKDGLAFWNQVTMSPVHDGAGEVTHFVGVQTDVSGRIEADRARDRALAAEQLARGEAERTQERLRLLSDAADRLTGHLDAVECRRRLLDVVVPAFADMAAIFHVDERGEITDWEARHRDPALADTTDQLVGSLPEALREGGPIRVFLDGEQSRLISDLQTDEGRLLRQGFMGNDTFVPRSDALDIDSTIFATMPGRREAHDLLVLNRTTERMAYDDDDRLLAADLGRRAGLLLDNARLYQGQHRIAETLQRSLLTQLPAIERAELAARYLPGEAGAEVGGDFYDVAQLSDGSLCLVVGDVLGHDVMAAAAMGHLKGMLWAIAHDTETTPAGVLERVDQLLAAQGSSSLATVLLARLTPVPDSDEWQLTWSTAGHPALVVRHPDGSAEMLEAERGAGREQLLGVGQLERTERTVLLPPGATVVAYTDGLVERRGEVIDTGFSRLLDDVRSGPDDVHGLCEHLVVTLDPGQREPVAAAPGAHTDLDDPATPRPLTEDDIAVLVVRLLRRDGTV